MVMIMSNDSATICDEQYVEIEHKAGHFELCDIKDCVKYYCLNCLKFAGSDCGLEYDDI